MNLKKILPFLAVLSIIFFLVALLFQTEGFGGRIPGFSTQGYSGYGINPGPIAGMNIVFGMGILAGFLILASVVSFMAF